MKVTKTDDGGAAFPVPKMLTEGWSGMSMRDYFAAAALQGLLSQSMGQAAFSDLKFAAEYAYAAADAMLEWRKRVLVDMREEGET